MTANPRIAGAHPGSPAHQACGTFHGGLNPRPPRRCAAGPAVQGCSIPPDVLAAWADGVVVRVPSAPPPPNCATGTVAAALPVAVPGFAPAPGPAASSCTARRLVLISACVRVSAGIGGNRARSIVFRMASNGSPSYCIAWRRVSSNRAARLPRSKEKVRGTSGRGTSPLKRPGVRIESDRSAVRPACGEAGAEEVAPAAGSVCVDPPDFLKISMHLS